MGGKPTLRCGDACYDNDKYVCPNGLQLQEKPTTPLPPPPSTCGNYYPGKCTFAFYSLLKQEGDRR